MEVDAVLFVKLAIFDFRNGTSNVELDDRLVLTLKLEDPLVLVCKVFYFETA